VVGLLCAIGAVLATFLPATADDGASRCGTWIAPRYGADETDVLLERAHGLYLDARQAGDAAGAREVLRIAGNIRAAAADCAGTLETRRTVALVLVGLAVVGPVAVMFIGGREREPVRT
jgi:hypothetical protein